MALHEAAVRKHPKRPRGTTDCLPETSKLRSGHRLKNIDFYTVIGPFYHTGTGTKGTRNHANDPGRTQRRPETTKYTLKGDPSPTRSPKQISVYAAF